MEGLTYPIPFSDPEAVIQIAKHAEKLGYHSVWGNDHMTTQNYVRKEFNVPPRFWDPLVTYAFVAAETTKLRFGTGILVLPMRRDIVVTAKQITTLDHFSGGRLEIGVGIGAYREEFLSLQPHTMMSRGKILDEGIPALQDLFRERRATFNGKYFSYKNIELYPKPMQEHIPFYIGGNNHNNLYRTAKWGDGWLPAAVHVDQISADITKLRELTDKEGRDFSAIEVAPQYIVHIGKTRESAIEQFNKTQMCAHLTSLRQSTLKDQGPVGHEEINLIGSVEDIIERANLLSAAGVTHLLGLYFAANNLSELLEQMQVFAEEVVPKIT
tara:strand:+ start:1407 stop:2384 length:978 start_codon:yes stop_codon:yes gene_type:complete